MKVKCAVFAYQAEFMAEPQWQFFSHGTDGKMFGPDYTLIDADAVVEFVSKEDVELIKTQVKAMEEYKTYIDAEAYRKKTKLDERIGKLLALTYEKN